MKKHKIDVINLEHRIDRKNQFIESMKGIIDFDAENFDFFRGVYTPANGMLGCALSHFTIVSKFLTNFEYEYQVVFEDDFVFRNPTCITTELNSLCESVPNWDVFLMAHNTGIMIDYFKNNYLRIINSQTASGYVITRKIAPYLLLSFGKSINLMSRFTTPEQKDMVNSLFAHDHIWKQIQLENLFITTNPSLGFQRQSYSDIENKNVNYGV